MFEITRRSRDVTPMRDLISWLNVDPFLSMTRFEDEGNLPLDVIEGDEELLVRASLPGFRKEDIEVAVENGMLSVKAEHVEETETSEERYYRRERRVGSVSRRVALPGLLDETAAEAELTDGVLTIRIPRAAEARPKQVRIK